MPGAEVRSPVSTTMPLLTSSPAPMASPVRGTTPMPATTKSHSISRPRAVLTRSTTPPSDQYDVGMEYSGFAPQWDEVVFRGDRAGGEFIAFWLRDGRVAAGMNVNVWDVNADVEALIRSGAKVDADALADPDIPLTTLLAARPPRALLAAAPPPQSGATGS
jgi:hypothetical protein